MLYNFLDLNRKSRTALCTQLYEGLKRGIEEGFLEPGEHLLSIREASRELYLSRTTVENAYQRLTLEGYAVAVPQSGYRVRAVIPRRKSEEKEEKREVRYDFTTHGTDPDEADMDNWRKILRRVLTDVKAVSTYGEAQGETELRKALSSYAFRARGVDASSERIYIGAGTGPLLQLLCPLLDRSMRIYIEKPGFPMLERVFRDYGFEITYLSSDGEYPEDENCMLVLLPSMRSRRSADEVSQDRKGLMEWLEKSERRMVLEDDYNGELRYRSRPLSSFQGLAPSRTVYIGSFSKLLLPSVRIAYMVLPDRLSDEASPRLSVLNQTAGKTEQLALAEYITEGLLEKHLRRLRRLYLRKSQAMESAFDRFFGDKVNYELLETSLSFQVSVLTGQDAEGLVFKANGAGTALRRSGDGIIFGFSSVSEAEIEKGMAELSEIWKL